MRKFQTRREMETFKAEQARWRELEIAAINDENRRIMEHAASQDQREAGGKAAKVKALEDREVLQMRIHAQIDKERVANEELDKIRDDLAQEEMHEQSRQKDRAEVEARMRQRLQLQRNQVEAAEAKQKRREQEVRDEVEFVVC